MCIEPIEQNVHGQKGVYQLVYFMKESKSLERFRKQAEKSNLYLKNKTPIEIERLFWKNLKHSAPIYGADVEETLFDSGIPWNLGEL